MLRNPPALVFPLAPAGQGAAGLFPFAPLRLEFVALEPFRAPAYKGGLFRSGLGLFLRGMACATGAAACTGCPHLERCLYAELFENPVLPGRHAVLRRYTHAPHPFVLLPPLDRRTFLPAGTRFEAGLTLLPPAMPHAADLLEALHRMGQSGSYGGRFELRRVVSALTGQELGRLGSGQGLLEPPVWRPAAAPPAAGRVRLEFLTPVRLRTRGRYNPRPGFLAILHALLRRLHLLSAVHGGGSADAAWMQPLLAAGDRIVTRRAEWELFRWSRPSARQQGDIPMDGLLGALEAEGELAPLLPYLEAGEWLHVGSGTSLGMGKYRLTVLG
ncbi:MAG: CRISPR system precrRNA processing endoribonuclease RAMP protein Cas6 [Bryobacteraceae bacterium]|nr:CRISPR system precrRNA processing endoribonuclease RAMP protein Cas6 [Bryobacteraceae bacterium]